MHGSVWGPVDVLVQHCWKNSLKNTLHSSSPNSLHRQQRVQILKQNV